MAQQNTKTPVSVVQEFTVKHGYSPPEYLLKLSKTGSHEDEFHYIVIVGGIQGFGFGHSKKVAKQNAASDVLEKLAKEGLYDPSSNPYQYESDSPLKLPLNFIESLKNMCYKHKLPYPVFTERAPHYQGYTYECKVASVVTQATAPSKKQAKQLAAGNMLDKIRDIYQIDAQGETDPNALMESMEKEQEVAKKYTSPKHRTLTKIQKISNVQKNDPASDLVWTMDVQHFALTIKKIMHEKNLTLQDFQQQFANRNRDGLNYIFHALDIKYKIASGQENPPIAYAIFELETPFTITEIGSDKENAELNLVYDIFKLLDINVNNMEK